MRISVRTGVALLGIFCWCASALGAEPSLEARLVPLVKQHKGQVAIAVKHLRNGDSYYFHSDEPMPTASLIKLAVMIEAYQQAEEGKIRLNDPLTLQEKDKVPGSGVLTEHFSAGATLSLRDAIRLMIAFSDNTATNLVLDKIGIGATAQRMKGWGYPNTRIHAKVFRGDTTSIAPERSKRFGLGSTTAREMIGILENLEMGKLVSPRACKEMLEHLKKCNDQDKFTRFLPAETVVAHKTGSVNSIRTDAGILYLPTGPLALCVLTEKNEDQTWRPDNAGNMFCAKVAKEVYDYFEARTEVDSTIRK